MSKIFPKDCELDCKYYSEYDMSVDDLVGICGLLKLQCDLCEGDSSTVRCPLEEQEVN